MDSTDVEIWKDCPIRGDIVEVSSLGRFRYKPGCVPNKATAFDPVSLIIETRKRSENSNTIVVGILGHRYTISWLVATAFVENPAGFKRPYHINGNPSDNRSVNLSWIAKANPIKKKIPKSKNLSDRDRLMGVWGNIGTRCNNPNCWCYSYYGGRGIRRCKEWNHFNAFYEWAKSSGYRFGLQLDRIDNNGDYSPDNCRWVTREENGKNKRNNHYIIIDGKAMTIAEIAELTGVNWHTVYKRLKRGWPPDLLTSKWGYKGKFNAVSGDKRNKKAG